MLQRIVLWKLQGKCFHKNKINLFGLKTSLEINVHLIRSSMSKGNDVEFWFFVLFCLFFLICVGVVEVVLLLLCQRERGSRWVLCLPAPKAQSPSCPPSKWFNFLQKDKAGLCCPLLKRVALGQSFTGLGTAVPSGPCALENNGILGGKCGTAVSSQIALAMAHIVLALQWALWTHPCGCCFRVHWLQHLSMENNSSFDICTEFHRMMFRVAWFWVLGFCCWLGFFWLFVWGFGFVLECFLVFLFQKLPWKEIQKEIQEESRWC